MPDYCSRGCGFFEPGAPSRASLASGGQLAKFARNQAIYSEGETALHSYRVVEGSVRLSRLLLDGHRQVLDILLPNDAFGIGDANTYPDTANAIGNVVAVRCMRTCIRRQSAQPEFGRQMMGMLSRSLSAAQDHITLLGHQGAMQRVASFLLWQMKCQNCVGDTPIELPVGRQDMADYLGLTIETTCRTLSNLKLSGIITIPSRCRISVCNVSRLQAASEGCAHVAELASGRTPASSNRTAGMGR
jgi:CRP/FNR family nitrogen fixation transcriptional regulator